MDPSQRLFLESENWLEQKKVVFLRKSLRFKEFFGLFSMAGLEKKLFCLHMPQNDQKVIENI